METTINSNQTKVSVRTERVNSSSLFWNNVESSRFGIISMLVVIIGCTGGLAASFGAQADVFRLAMVAFPTIIALALTLAVAPMKTIIYVSSIAVILDLIVLIF